MYYSEVTKYIRRKTLLHRRAFVDLLGVLFLLSTDGNVKVILQIIMITHINAFCVENNI